jgi:hypothetical protein
MEQGMDVMPFATGLASTVLIIVLGVWSLIWKGIALWKAARRDRVWWYVAMLVLNTVGILPIIYIYAVAPNQPEIDEAPPPAAPEA